MAHDDLTFSASDVSGTAVQAHTIHGNVYLQPPSPAAPPKCDPPATWAETTDLPAEIAHLLWAQEQAADLLPYQLPGARTPTLGTVYVRQDLGGGVEDTQADDARPSPMLDEHGQLVETPVAPTVRVSVRPPSKPMRTALDTDPHLLVLGGPGQGKSTLTLRLAADVVRHWSVRSDDEDAPLAEPVIPLRITARTLAQHLGSSFTQALADSAFAEYSRYLSGPLDPALLAERVAGCRWLLLVDALDEVADSSLRATLVHTLSAWASRSTYRVLLTTRPTESGALAALQRAGAARYELQPFDAEALCRFARNWFADIGEDDADRFLYQIREAHLDELVEVPLLATIAAVVFEQHRQRPLPGNQYELYESYLDYIRSSRPANDTFEPHRVALTEHLGRARLATDTPLAVAVHDWAYQHDVTQVEDLIAYVASVGPFMRRNNDIAFLHHSFAEHVAATSMARELPAEFAAEHTGFAELLHAAHAEEGGRFARAVLLHYSHLHAGEADRVLSWLHKGGGDEHLLAARLLARHMPTNAQLVTDFLATARAWAMTTSYPARLILQETSRATRHLGLVEWLGDLMRTESAPWESRAEAAIALAVRLRCVHTDAAVAFLRAALDSHTTRVEDRLTAAEALAHSGSSEREAAERGLRSVLSDPFASGAECRGAAVVLSAFDGEARSFAVAALQRLVSDEDAPTDDLVEAATGLLEIGAEFHDQCAEIFLAVLRDPVDNSSGRRDAAIGLASLGAREVAAEVLTATLANRGLSSGVRVTAAAALALLGRQHRVAAAELLLADLDPATAEPVDRVIMPTTLARLGYRDQAVAILREVLADPSVNWNVVSSAARSLMDLGPAFRDEAAAHVEKMVAEVPPLGYDYTAALQALADCGEPRRGHAVATMREVLADPAINSTTRCQVASNLIRCAPEFHTETVGHLVAITRFERDPDVLSAVWQQLRWLGPDLCGQAKRAMLALAVEHHDDFDVPDDLGIVVSSSGESDRVMTADVLRTVVRDESRGARARVSAARGLGRLGIPFQREAVEALRDLIETGAVAEPTFPARYFTKAGRGARSVLAEALHEALRNRNITSRRAYQTFVASELLGFRAPDDTLRHIVDDGSASAWTRAEAALKLARTDAAYLARATDLVFDVCGDFRQEIWRPYTAELMRLGVDVRSRLRQVVSDPNAGQAAVATAASLLGEEGRAVLRKHAEDPYLSFYDRSNAYRLLAASDRAALPAAVAYARTVLDDPDEWISERCFVVSRLVELDRSYTKRAIALLWRWAEDPRLKPEERASVAFQLQNVEGSRSHRLTRMYIGLCQDPALPEAWRWSVAQRLPRPQRTEVERVMLADHSVSVNHRITDGDVWGDAPLLSESEAVVRGVLTDPTSTRRERRFAAVELGGLSDQFVPEAVRLLLADGSPAALVDAAHLGGWTEVHERALEIVPDETRPARERWTAVLVAGRLSRAQHVREYLLSNVGASWRDRVDALSCARAFDELRKLRDDPAGPSAQRRRAAGKLTGLTPDDRAAAARVYREIATDVTARPALRWRAADDLAGLGARGRAEGAPLLRALATDESLPVLVRSDAAAALRERCATSRQETLAIQRGFLATREPLQRANILLSIGWESCGEAVAGLLRMADDRQLSPRVRLRCVQNVMSLRRDQMGRCALVAREVAFDPATAWHVRLRAAKYLSEWSEVMREDARALARELRCNPPR